MGLEMEQLTCLTAIKMLKTKVVSSGYLVYKRCSANCSKIDHLLTDFTFDVN